MLQCCVDSIPQVGRGGVDTPAAMWTQHSGEPVVALSGCLGPHPGLRWPLLPLFRW